jgi:hypothetical protein
MFFLNLKHYKYGATVITYFFIIPQIHSFFFQKKSKNKIKTDDAEKAHQGRSQTYGKIKL